MIDFDLTIHHLRFECETQSPVQFGPQAGAQLRGALWAALEQFAGSEDHQQTDPHHQQHCPLCRLMNLETIQGVRGHNPARPFAIQPPLTGSHFQPGEGFTFGISLFGTVADLIPYVIQAAYRIGHIGVGYGRGRFALKQVQAINPLTKKVQDLLCQGRAKLETLCPVINHQIQATVDTLPRSSVRLRFLTPTQITSSGKFDSKPIFPHLMGRLLERCQSLEKHYTPIEHPHEQWKAVFADLTSQAESIKVGQDYTRWVQVHSGSRRSGTRKPLSGFVGDVVVHGNLVPFYPWLLWGQSLHVGKNAVKGNGWYQIVHDVL